MTTIDVTTDEWEKFRELSERQMTRRKRYWERPWVAVFSANSRGDEWSFANWGTGSTQRTKSIQSIQET